MTRGPVGRRLRALAAACAALLVTPLALATPAAAAVPGRFTAHIVAMDPALPSGGTAVAVSVELANSTADAVTGITARFLIATSPLQGRSEIAGAAAGAVVPNFRTLPATVASGIDVASGASTTLRVRTTTRALGLLQAPAGVYVVGVLINGTTSRGSQSWRAVTLLPWMTGHVTGGIGVAAFWTLTAPPSRGVDGVFLDDSLALAVQPGGRLRLQLDAITGLRNTTLLVDPLLIESLQALATGARIRLDSGDVRATTDAEMRAAQQWLTDLRTVVADNTLAALPVGDLDVTAALQYGRIGLARHALANAPQRLATALNVPLMPLIVPLHGGAVPGTTWRLLDEFGAAAVLAPESGYVPTQTRYTQSAGMAVAASGRPVLVVDDAASNAPVTPGLNDTEARQAFAAQLLMAYLERPNDDRAIAVAVPPTWTPEDLNRDTAVLTSDWVHPLSVAQAAAFGSTERASRTLPMTTTQRVQNTRTGVAVSREHTLQLLTSDAAFASAVDDGVAGMMSRWYTARIDPTGYVSAVTDALTTLADSVRVVTHGEIVFGGERGSVPVTIENGLPVPVDIGLQASGIPSVRVQPTHYTPVHINAGKRVSVEVPTQVTGSGDASLLLQVVAGDRVPIGSSTIVTVRSAAYARVASYVVAIAFAALLLLVAANTVRRIRSRSLGLDDGE